MRDRRGSPAAGGRITGSRVCSLVLHAGIREGGAVALIKQGRVRRFAVAMARDLVLESTVHGARAFRLRLVGGP